MVGAGDPLWAALLAECSCSAWLMGWRLHRDPSQQSPCRSMLLQGLLVPLTVQEGRWHVLMNTGTEKLPAGGQGAGQGCLGHPL